MTTTTYLTSRRSFVSCVAAIPAALLVGCGDEEETATDRDTIPEVTPGANDELPGDIESATVTITDGEFDVDEISVTQGAPTELNIVNQDSDAYTFEVEGLVTGQTIEANATTEVGFTTPDDGTFDGRLSDADGTTVDEFQILVVGPGGA